MSKNNPTAIAVIPKVTKKPIVPGELYVSSGTGVGVVVASVSKSIRKFMQ